jgi:UDP-N-acetylmuramate: L-alanyl-gamma-D-glutamyl-meso-diaminopimelate ligase
VESCDNQIKKYPYKTPDYSIENGITQIETPEGLMPIEVFGEHNLNNLAGAKWICQHMGIDEVDFFEAIAVFKGASKRLERIAENATCVVYKDFAHSPSKVSATTKAVKNQYPNRKVIACLELHTYSSLNMSFLKEYRHTLDAADESLVFYSPDAVKIKQLDMISEQQISEAFACTDLSVFSKPATFKERLFSLDLENTVLLFMSSGNYGGLDLTEIINKIEA